MPLSELATKATQKEVFLSVCPCFQVSIFQQFVSIKIKFDLSSSQETLEVLVKCFNPFSVKLQSFKMLKIVF